MFLAPEGHLIGFQKAFRRAFSVECKNRRTNHVELGEKRRWIIVFGTQASVASAVFLGKIGKPYAELGKLGELFRFQPIRS